MFTSPSSTSDGDNDGLLSSSTTTTTTTTLFPRLLAGSIGSIVTALAVTPLEVVKIRQQAAGASAFNHSSMPSSSSLFRGVKIGPSTTCPGCGTIILNNGLMDCVLPIETALPPKPRTSSTLVSSSSASMLSLSRSAPKSGGGTIATLVSIFRNEGISSLYAGLRPTLVMSVPNTVLYFTAYDEISIRLRRYYHSSDHLLALERSNHNSSGRESEQTVMSTTDKQFIVDDNNANPHPAYIPLVAGSTARLLATMATAPLELIRTRQASVVATRPARDGSSATRSSSIAIPGILDEFRVLVQTRGISSLYAGLAPTLWRDVPFSALYWLFFERFRNALSDMDSSSSSEKTTTLLGRQWGVIGGANFYRERGMKLPPGMEAMHAFVAGAAAGSIAAAFTTPFDVIKTRQQMVGGGNGQTKVVNKSNNIAVEGAEYYCGRQACAESIHQGRLLPAAATIPTTTTSAAFTTNRNVGTFGYMHQIVQTEGVSGLWKGNVTRMVKIAPACAVMISCYELGKRVFEV